MEVFCNADKDLRMTVYKRCHEEEKDESDKGEPNALEKTATNASLAAPGERRKRTKKLAHGIDNMMTEAMNQDKDVRHKDLGHIIAHMNLFYNRTGQVAKISPLEFSQIADWHWGLPFLVLDFVDALTGSNMVAENEQFYSGRKLIEVIQKDDKEFQDVHERIQENFIRFPTQMFNQLGDLDFAEILKKEEKYFD